MRLQDSLRYATDSIADLQKDSMSVAYLKSTNNNIDSTSTANNKRMYESKMQSDNEAYTQASMIANTNISEAKRRQVKIINTTFTQRANVLMQENDQAKLSQQLALLNEERRIKLASK